MMRCTPLILSLLLSFGLAALPAAAQSLAIDKVLVVVNEETITLSEYQTRHQQEVLQEVINLAPFDGTINPQILNHMIDDRIQAQIATRRGITISKQDVDQSVAFIAQKNNTTQAQLFQQLAADGITPTQFRASMEQQQLIRRLVEVVINSRVTVSNQEVENYLASHRELIASDESWAISHLVIALPGTSDKQANEQVKVARENLAHIRTAIVDGRSFAQSAREFSDGPNSDAGGYLGWRKAEQLPELFVDALQQTEVGGVSEIIQSSNGMHLLHIHERKGGAPMVEQQLLRHILIRNDAQLNEDDTEQLANELYSRILAGEDFAALARGYSADQSSGIDGGHLGWINPGDLPPELERAVAKLALNELSKPLRVAVGYHLLEVLERRRVDISREVATKRAQQVIFQRKAATFYDNWFGAIRDGAHIEYLINDVSLDSNSN